MVLAYLIFLLLGTVILINFESKGILRQILGFWPILLITFGIHYFITSHSTAVKVDDLIFSLNYPALSKSVFFTIRIAVFLAISLILGKLYSPQIYAQEFCKPFRFVPFLRRPMSQIEMMISLSFRFIPFIKREYQRILLALRARGILIQKRGLKNQLFFYRKALYPLFLAIFRRSETVAFALQARGYNPDIRRTYYKVYKLSVNDIVFSVIFIGLSFISFRI